MKGYDLDEKGGLFGIFGIRNAAKLLKAGESVSFTHYSNFDCIRLDIKEVNENTVRLLSQINIPGFNLHPGDHVVLSYNTSDIRVMCGEILAVEKLDPLELTVKISQIDKLKDMRLDQRLTVSLTGDIKTAGGAQPRFAIIKNLSLGGIKLNCKEYDIRLEDMVDVTVKLDKANKFTCRGMVVRKKKAGDFFEYGIEMYEVGESNMRLLYQFIEQYKYS